MIPLSDGASHLPPGDLCNSMPSPSEPKSRTKPADVRQEELMDAALKLFIDKGISATSIDEIVTSAGVSKGGFYHHFASKEALLGALQERYITDFMTVLVKAQGALPADDWHGRLDTWLKAGVDHLYEAQPVHDVVFHEFASPNHKEMNQNIVVDHMHDFLAAGTQAGAWSVSHPRLMAVMLFNAVHGACDEALLSPETLDRDTLIRVLQDFCWRAVGPV